MSKTLFASIILLLLLVQVAQAVDTVANKVKITGLYFFGYKGLDLAKIQKVIPLKSGDEVDRETWFEFRKTIANAIKKEIRKESTDAALIGYDKTNIVFIGLPGELISEPTYTPAPKEKLALPDSIRKLYREQMEALSPMVASGKKEDREKFEELERQLKLAAQKDPQILIDVLRKSSDANDRIVASEALGMIASNESEILTLVYAAKDSASVVRNNATRALGVLLLNNPAIANMIPPGHFIEMLNSPTWTDRNKAVFTLLGLTKSRDPKVLSEMRSKGESSLREMCDWPVGYSSSAYRLLGRIANIPEDKLQKLIYDGKGSEILSTLDSIE